jgi:hypothetical protein
MNQPLPKEFSEWSLKMTANQSLYCGLMQEKKQLVRDADAKRVREHNRKRYHETKPQTK